jgi:hypothetical protein
MPRTKTITIADPFRATGAELKAAAAQGNEVAIAEIARRAAKRAEAGKAPVGVASAEKVAATA